MFQNFGRGWRPSPPLDEEAEEGELVPLREREPGLEPFDDEDEDVDAVPLKVSGDSKLKNRPGLRLVVTIVALVSLVIFLVVLIGPLSRSTDRPESPNSVLQDSLEDGLPYAKWWEHDRTLPQGNATLPPPEGGNGTFLYFPGHMWGKRYLHLSTRSRKRNSHLLPSQGQGLGISCQLIYSMRY